MQNKQTNMRGIFFCCAQSKVFLENLFGLYGIQAFKVFDFLKIMAQN